MNILDKLKGLLRRMFSKDIYKKITNKDIALSDAMMRNMDVWNAMLKGQAEWCTGDVTSLHLESGICREFANVTLSEMETKLDDEELNESLKKALILLRDNMQDGLGLGSFVLKPIADSGEVEFITGDRIIPISFDSSGELRECAFVEIKPYDDKVTFYRIEQHRLDSEGLTITNRAFKGKDGAIDEEIPLSYVSEWGNLEESVTYPSMEQMDFGYYRNPLSNHIDGSYSGVSIFADAVNLIQKADIQSARIDYEYESGERMIFADWTTVKGDNGNFKLPQRKQRLIVRTDQENQFMEFSPSLRDANFIVGKNEYLREIEFAVSLAYGDLSKNEIVEKTATEIRQSRKRKYDMVTAIQSNLENCIRNFIDAVAFYHAKYTTNYELTISFHDSIMTTEEEERDQDRQDVKDGYMTPLEYRMKWYNEDEETACKTIRMSDAERQQDRSDMALGVLSPIEYRMKWYGETEDQAKKAIQMNRALSVEDNPLS